MKIEVKQKDIARGIRQSTVGCPIARSILRDVLHVQPGAWRKLSLMDRVRVLEVRSSSVCLASESIYQLPPAARQFIGSFDAGVPTKPFSFSLPLRWVAIFKARRRFQYALKKKLGAV